jgi:hypothetical protein
MRIADFSRLLFSDLEAVDVRTMSPLVPHSLYQAALVQFQSWKQNNEVFCKQRLDSLKRILGHFKRRWLIAGIVTVINVKF